MRAALRLTTEKTTDETKPTKKRPTRKSWFEWVQSLKDYAAENGHCQVPRTYDLSLSAWSSRQRKAYWEGRLLPEQIQALEEIGFRWQHSSKQSITWWRHFKKIEKHLNDELSIEELSPTSSGWLTAQQSAYARHLSGEDTHLDAEMLEAMKAVDIDWRPRRLQAWDARLQELKEYKGEYQSRECVRNKGHIAQQPL